MLSIDNNERARDISPGISRIALPPHADGTAVGVRSNGVAAARHLEGVFLCLGFASGGSPPLINAWTTRVSSSPSLKTSLSPS
jgi:hypothetical protein